MRVLVLGDVMVDRYTYVETTRRAPEAGIPVWDEVRHETRLGGAANVALNVSSMAPDVDVYLAGILGDRHVLSNTPLHTEFMVSGETMVKHRFVAGQQGTYLFRHDNIKAFSKEAVAFFGTLFDGWMFESLASFDAVIVSDYDKGTVNERTISAISGHPLVVVDTKRADLRLFNGARLLKLNEDEYSAQVSSPLYPCFDMYFQHCVVTRGGKSTQLRQCELTKSNDKRYVVHVEEFPVERVTPVDVTGCGDTHVAAMVVSLLRDGDVRRAVRFANDRATEVVQKFGTSV